MSEYQYYEFRTIDRPLNNQQIRELRAYSSRAEITSTTFTVEYNWGDFKGDPFRWMEKYFDAFAHVANWGTRWLMLRIPKQLLDPELVSEYCLDEYLSFSTKGENIIVSFRMDDDEPEWTDGEGWLASLISLRKDLMQGDHRCLYLAWLCSIQGGDFEDDVLEPPVPAGLGNLTASLERLADFLCIDFDLIAAAAEQSKSERDPMLSKGAITDWVATLPLEDKNAALVRMIEDDASHLAAEIRQRALKGVHAQRQAVSGSQSSNCRSAGQILARAEAIAEEREKIVLSVPRGRKRNARGREGAD